MSREALKDLLEKVEAGEFQGPPFFRGRGSNEVEKRLLLDADLYDEAFKVKDAYHGSLDAAKALHEAVLPGWGWAVEVDGDMIVASVCDYDLPDGTNFSGFEVVAENPARAWLVAILKSLIAEQE